MADVRGRRVALSAGLCLVVLLGSSGAVVGAAHAPSAAAGVGSAPKGAPTVGGPVGSTRPGVVDAPPPSSVTRTAGLDARAGPTPAGTGTSGPTCNTISPAIPPVMVGDYTTNGSQGSSGFPFACVLIDNLLISPGTTLSLWGGYGGILVNDSLASNRTISIDVAGDLTIGDGATLWVNPADSARITVQGTLTVLPQSNLTLSPTSSLILDPGSRLIIDGGVFYTEGQPITGDGGSISVTNVAGEGGVDGSLAGPENPTSHPQELGVYGIDLSGSITSFSDDLSAVHFVNSTANLGGFSVLGFASLPVEVANVTLPSVGTFQADDAVVSGVSLTSVSTVVLGSVKASPDLVEVFGLTIGKPVGNLSIAHGIIASLGITSAGRVDIVNSTLLGGASSVTQATASFSANLSSGFRFPLVFNNAPWVNLTNVSAPAISVQGFANVTVYNWGGNTTFSGSTAQLSSISTSSTQVAVHVLRYVLAAVAETGSTTLPPGTTVTWCQTSTSVCVTTPVGPQGTVGRFLPTDVVTSAGVDAFVGSYSISAQAPNGYTAAAVAITVTSDGQQASLQLTPPVVPPQLLVIFGLEVTGMAAAAAAIIFMRARLRRLRKTRPKVVQGTPETSRRKRLRPARETTDAVEKDPARGPPLEWKGPGP